MRKFYLISLILLLFISNKCICQSLAPVGMGGLFSCNSCKNINGYKVVSVLLSTVNCSSTAFDYIFYNKSEKYKSSAGFGIITGLVQITYGIMYKDDCPVKSRNVYQGINIGIGLIAIISSGIRLLKKENNNSKPTSLNLFINSPNNKNFGMGLILTKRI